MSNTNRINKAKTMLQAIDVPFAVHQYDQEDRELRALNEVELFRFPRYEDYYYRMEPYLDTPRGKIVDKHFGVVVSNEGSNSFDMGIYTNQLLNNFIKNCATHRELLHLIGQNLKFHYERIEKLSELTCTEFDSHLSDFLNKYSFFSKIEDLALLRKRSGLYIMVLDDYASCYIGQAHDLKIRIQQHWRKTDFGTVGIDMFKALDTTRIFALCTDSANQDQIDKMEYLFIHEIDRKHLLNAWGGGGSFEFIHSDSPTIGYGSDPLI